jgi:sugar phosphate isomerase/epimerase
MTPPIALQLYTVRDQVHQDFAGTIDQIAEIGFAGVETANFPASISPKQAGRIIRKAGLQVVSAHAPLPLGDQKDQVLDRMAGLDCNHLVCPWMDPSCYETETAIEKTAGLFNEAAQIAHENGLRFSIHNHWFEFETVNGIPAYQILLKTLSPDVLFEIDIYWVKTGGQDPVLVLEELGDRAPLVHVKDGPADHKDSIMVAVGQGSLDIPAILHAGEPQTETYIVELDRCATDMMTAVRESYHYLTRNGLSRGHK